MKIDRLLRIVDALYRRRTGMDWSPVVQIRDCGDHVRDSLRYSVTATHPCISSAVRFAAHGYSREEALVRLALDIRAAIRVRAEGQSESRSLTLAVAP